MSDNKIYLGLCVHSHQPVGNSHEVFLKGFQKCYMPFLEILQEYPHVSLTLHYSGPLLEWLEQNRPEFFDVLSGLVDRGQVELMGGGFYEPIIPVIPRADVRRQITMSSRYLEERFKTSPRGIWCTERIWEPDMPLKVSGLGVEYTLLDDSHFLSAGIDPEDVHGYYMTERLGHPLKVFPVDMRLRYMIPFREPQETIDYLYALRDKGVRMVTYGDDGEKFGMWPGTYDWVIDQGWLRRFFDEMGRVSDHMEIIPLSRAIDSLEPRALVYLPTSTYQEMMEWSLPAAAGRHYKGIVEQAKQAGDWEKKRGFVRGGMWDNFLAKYPESNLMHKKMLHISAMTKKAGMPAEAEVYLLRAQCNCAYWHGLFGGVYLRGLRDAVYSNLLKAEDICDSTALKDRPWTMEIMDYDMDGRDEVCIQGRILNLFISPHKNAGVFALEYKPAFYSLSNILMRHPEIYHQEILDTPSSPDSLDNSDTDTPLSIHDMPRLVTDELKAGLVYDTYPRFSFMTHILDTPPCLDAIRGTIPESLYSGLEFSFVNPDGLEEAMASKDSIEVSFEAIARGMCITKTYTCDAQARVSVLHQIDNPGQGMWIGIEWNIMIVSGERPRVEGKIMDEGSGVFHTNEIVLQDTSRAMVVRISSGAVWDVCISPIECVSQNENGFEKGFQGWNCIFLRALEGPVPKVFMEIGPTQEAV
ncbi:MAG: alpha-amylase/4-alpha-glucanotransferase domain-containing protein [Thermodesulfobacteriota bacterium]|nr:alpha-amylase/4-alpha-glucanotransferase domain-containing protein [Thermodesulfobacteriota bacterium]